MKAIYLIGSTLEGRAGQGSDIDLIAHMDGDATKMQLLSAWMEGWSLCLTEINFLKTGYKSDIGLLDLHMVTDADIEKKDSYAVMIQSTEGGSHLLRKA